MKDVLTLHDTISYESPIIWNKEKGGKSGNLSFVDGPTKRKAHEFPFIGNSGDRQLFRGALYPMLAAFRWMVVPYGDVVKWRRSFDDTLKFWRKVAVRLMEATMETNRDLGRSRDAIGKSSNHWKNLYNEVAMQEIMVNRVL